MLQDRGITLKGVFLTHYHADFVAGHLNLRRKYGCDIYMGPMALEAFGIKSVRDSEMIKVGAINLKVIHTPGHTEESTCLLLVNNRNQPKHLFTGDTVFIDEVGRPDLAVKTGVSTEQLARLLYRSINHLK